MSYRHSQLTSSRSSSVLNVVFECGTWEGCDVRSSMRTSFPLLTHRLLHFRLQDHPILRRANLAWRALSWCRRSSVRPPHDIEKSVAHRLHCAMPLPGNFAIQAPPILVKLAFSLIGTIFFQRGLYASAISYP